MEAAIVLGLGFIFGAWRLWVAIDRNESGHHRSYPQGGARAPGYLVAPGRDELHPCYAPGQYEREQSDRGIGREAAGSIFTRLRQQEEENEARLAVLIQGESGPDWAGWQRDPDPVAVPTAPQRAAPIQHSHKVNADLEERRSGALRDARSEVW
jgi:hypothetical protein